MRSGAARELGDDEREGRAVDVRARLAVRGIWRRVRRIIVAADAADWYRVVVVRL